MAVEWDEIEQFVADGETPDTIPSLLNSDSRHKKDTNAAALFSLLVNEYSLLRHVGVDWTGRLQDRMDELAKSPDPKHAALVDGYNQLLSNPWSSEAIIRSGSKSRVGQLVSGIAVVAGQIIEDDESDSRGLADLVRDVHLLTDGPRRTIVATKQSVEKAIADHEKSREASRIDQRITNAEGFARERIRPGMTPDEQGEAWASAWSDAGG